MNFRPRSFATSKSANPMQLGFKQGVYTLKKGLAGVDYLKPAWHGKESIFRILPGLSPDGESTFDPCRISEEQGRYGTWQCCFEAVRNFGEPGITMLLSNGDQGYDPYNQNPCWILYRAIKNSIERKQAKPEWYPLMMDNPQKGKILSAPSEITLVQSLVFRHKNGNTFGNGKAPYGFNQDDPTIVLEMSSSAAKAFFMELEQRRDDWDGDPHDPEAFVYPDICGIDSGAFVHFYQLGHDPREANTGPVNTPVDPYQTSGYGRFPRGGQRGGQGTLGGYGCFITETMDGGPSPPDIKPSLKGHEKRIVSKIKPWDDILAFYDDREQAHIINRLFPASAIVYAFGEEHPDWVLPDVRQAAVAAVSRSVPAGVPQNPQQSPSRSAPRYDDPFGPPDEEEENASAPDVEPAPAPVTRPQQSKPAAPRKGQDYTSPAAGLPDYSVPKEELPVVEEEDEEGTVLDGPSDADYTDEIPESAAPPQVVNPPSKPSAQQAMAELEAARQRANMRSRTNPVPPGQTTPRR